LQSELAFSVCFTFRVVAYKPIVLLYHMRDTRKGTKPKRDECSWLVCLCTSVYVMQ